MALYTIGDLHLHFQAKLKVKSQKRDPLWKNHEERFRRNCEALIRPEDTLVLAGDHSWGRNLAECEEDLEYICALPGRKILIRGNHDMFWDAKKTRRLNELYAGRLFFLQDNYAVYGEYALIGSKGFTFEGPFYLDRCGRIISWDLEAAERAERLIARLRTGFELAKKTAMRSSFCSCIIRPPTFWKSAATSPTWPRSTACHRSSMGTATASAASTTASWANFAGASTISSPATICAGNR